MTNCIEISHLCKSFDSFALKDICLKIPGGSIMGLIGENGAGKSTAIKCILNILHPDSGSISVLGYDSVREERHAKQDVGVVLDECFFHQPLQAKDVNTILAPVFHNWDRRLFFDYLEKFRLPPKKRIKDFSRGMKMKLSLAAALAHRPKLLILDEATAGLDPVVRDEILEEFLAFIQDEDHAILISSHITSDLEKIADYITYIHQGQIIISDSKDTVLDSYGRIACSAQQLDSIQPSDLLSIRRSSFQCLALTSDRRRFAQKYPDILVEPVSLEEIMLFISKGEKK